MSGFVECPTHGRQPLAMACRHTRQTALDDIPRGLYWFVDEEGDVNAYCDECALYLEANECELPENADTFIQGRVLCQECFQRVKSINERVI